MHLSAHIEPRTELAESRIETKLPIGEVRLLHVCLAGVCGLACGCAEMPVMGRYAPPVHGIELTGDAGVRGLRQSARILFGFGRTKKAAAFARGADEGRVGTHHRAQVRK